MSNVSDQILNNLNKSSDFWTKLSPIVKFDGEYKVTLVHCILENTNDTPEGSGLLSLAP